ncbi:MAG: amidohydrolase family protein [Candidatus Margulisiibacteriota bacterium]
MMQNSLPSNIRRIDPHVHLLPPKAWKGFRVRLPMIGIPHEFIEDVPHELDAAHYFAYAKQYGVFGLVNLPVASSAASAKKVREINQWCFEIQNESKDKYENRIKSFGAINPHLSDAEIDAELDYIVEAGFLGVKLHPIAFPSFQGFDPTDFRRHDHLYQGIAKRNLMICWHMGGVRLPMSLWEDLKHAATPEKVAMIIERYHICSVVAHMGNAPQERVIASLANKPEALLDTSYTEPVPGVITPFIRTITSQDIRLAISEFGIERILPGSDFPYRSIRVTIDAFNRLNLSEAEARTIWWDNPVRIFGFSDLD